MESYNLPLGSNFGLGDRWREEGEFRLEWENLITSSSLWGGILASLG